MTNNGYRILYIEDNPGNRVLVQRVLMAEGFEVLVAEDGPSGLACAQAEHPDLILMDINMPDVDGYTITTKIKALPELAQVPIIALTANVMKGDRDKTIAAGCDGYIQKPIDVDKLSQQIIQYLKK